MFPTKLKDKNDDCAKYELDLHINLENYQSSVGVAEGSKETFIEATLGSIHSKGKKDFLFNVNKGE